MGILTLEVSRLGYETQTLEVLVYPIFDTKVTVELEPGEGPGSRVDFDPIACILILVIFPIFSLIGVIACLRRRHLDVAIVGALIGIFSFGFFFLGSILSIIACIIIWKSKEEFENGKKGKIF